jgi:hypothetical protein
VLHYSKIYKVVVENQLENKIKWLRSDCGVEYLLDGFFEFCVEHGIILERTSSNSPQFNRIVERKNRTLTELVNTMLETSRLSKE